MRSLTLLTLLTILITISTTANGQGVQQIWGTTMGGGKDGVGTFFSLKADGTGFQKRYDFTTTGKGFFLWDGEMKANNGKLYGIALYGGIFGVGMLLECDPVNNIYTKKYDFTSNTGSPYGALSIKDNKIYGTTQKGTGAAEKGTIFEYDITTNTYTQKATFTDATGWDPVGGLLELNGKFYGVTQSGGANSYGTLYEYDPGSNTIIKESDFVSSSPVKGNSLATDGLKIYGFCENMIYEWNSGTSTLSNKYTFTDLAQGYNPDGGLTYYNNKFYGTTLVGGSNNLGVIFEWDPVSNIYNKKIDLSYRLRFNQEVATRIKLLNDKFYGVSYDGGTFNKGVIFEWNPSTNDFNIKTSFSSSTGNPENNFTELNGKFYGVSELYPDARLFDKALYEWDPVQNNISKKIELFQGDGAMPYTIIESAGKLYGNTFFGGQNNQGVFYEFDREAGIKVNKFNLSWAPGIYNPAILTHFNNNKIIGISPTGGSNDLGFILEWDTSANTVTSIYDFVSATGSNPNYLLSKEGTKIYGTTIEGGANNLGVIFEWDAAANSYTKKHDFTTISGGSPVSGLTKVGAKYFGLTRSGGINNNGTIYEWNPVTNVYIKRYDFLATEGFPSGNLVEQSGKLIGISYSGTYLETGSVFEWDTTTNSFAIKYTFTNADGGKAQGSLFNINSKIFGITWQDLPMQSGSIFEYDPVAGTVQNLHIFNDLDGTDPFWLILTSASVASAAPNSCTSYPSITIDDSNNNQWVAITDNGGNVVAEIKANGNNLGTVSSSLYINDGPVREDATKKLFLDRSLTITPQTQPTSAVDIRLYITEAEYTALKNATNSLGQPSGITSITDLGMFKNSDACNGTIVGVTSAVNNANVVYGGGGYVITGSVNSFSSFYFANRAGSALPLTLLNFDGELQQNNVLLKWKTTNEYNTGQFIIERSTDGRHFENTGTVKAKNQDGIQQYQYLDAAVTSLGKQIIYYRLLQIDNDNRQTYSNITAIALGNRADVIQWPNPVSNQVNLLLTVAKKEKIIVRILDLNGRSLKQDEFVAEKGSVTKTYNMEGIKKGTYIIEVKSETIYKNFKVVKQ